MANFSPLVRGSLRLKAGGGSTVGTNLTNTNLHPPKPPKPPNRVPSSIALKKAPGMR